MALADLHLLLFDMAEGALGWNLSYAVVDANGSSSLVEMFYWPARFRQHLMCVELTQLLRNAACVDMSTRHSGIDTPVYAFACLASALGISTWRHLYSREEDKLCREVLCRSSSCSCLFGDMMDVMPKGTRNHASQLHSASSTGEIAMVSQDGDGDA